MGVFQETLKCLPSLRNLNQDEDMGSRLTLTLNFLALVVIGVSGAIGYVIFVHGAGIARQSTCLANLHQLGIAYAQYAQDSDQEPLPISYGEQGWGDLLYPYLRQWEYFQCPAGQKPPNPRRTDYFYNSRLSERPEAIHDLRIILFGDGYDNSGLNAHLSELPFDWKDDEESGTSRHVWYPNYVFTDGHVKGIRFKNISNISITDRALYTFNPALTNQNVRKYSFHLPHPREPR